MCPSYMATREEEHATRGRANALVARAVAARPARRARRRAPARDPRPLPRVQGVQARVPARASTWRRSRASSSRTTRTIHGTPLRSRAFGAIRALNRAGAALAPVSNVAAAARPARARCSSARSGSRAERPLPRFERETLLRWDATAPRPRDAARRAATSSSSPTRSRRSPSPRSAARRSSCSSAPGWRVRLQSRGLLRAGEHLEGAARPGARRMARAMVDRLAADARARHADRRRRAVVPAHAARRVPRAAARRPARRGRRRARDARRRPARRGDRRGRPRRSPPTRRSPAAGSSSTATATRRRASGRRRRARCSSASPAPRSRSSTPAAAGWPARSASRPSTTTCRGRSASCGCSRRCADEPAETVVAATGVSCRQQIGHFAGRTARHPVELVAEAASSTGGARRG